MNQINRTVNGVEVIGEEDNDLIRVTLNGINKSSKFWLSKRLMADEKFMSDYFELFLNNEIHKLNSLKS